MRTGRRYWLQRGFIPIEASAFNKITTEAIEDSRYIRIMIQTRMRRRSQAIRNGWTIREYYRSIREMYVKSRFANRQSEIMLRGNTDRRNKARRIAFDFFNYYKDRYGRRDRTGRLEETPRRKVKARRKPITGKHNIDQMIRKDQDQIKFLRSRLKFERNEYMRSQLQTRIRRHQGRIRDLKARVRQQ